MPSPRMSAEDRKALVKAMRAKQRAADGRKAWLIYGTGGVVVASIIAATAFVVVGEVQKQETAKAEAARPVEGVQDFPDQSRNHISGPVSYPRNPPTGGDHAPVWTNCGIYTAPVEPTRAVHSLEHGAVWLSYRQDLPKDQVAELTSLAGAQDYLLLSPVTDQASPVTATAWGKQLSVDSSSDERIATFIKKYRQSPQAPEPGAVCTGGVDG
ncbi:DUF3105 domain-containing protein [Pseudarthrobacter sp. MDT3-26]|uniref:DUF3105 domain-containing protein n=1 Tax=Pseudarthrobacter raffinosi TaxID=2953651 RepID=UPI00208EF21F|nr:DUF3105 domain-containing protein [Pseudarthrobacter sp. MDT3-26]MCO4265233.1 DUF3105 domain-containing protein [Pseudarthrobacter sp. MDT3-26]